MKATSIFSNTSKRNNICLELEQSYRAKYNKIRYVFSRNVVASHMLKVNGNLFW